MMTTEESGRPELRVPLKAGERIDDLHRNGYQIIQQEKGFCFVTVEQLMVRQGIAPEAGVIFPERP